MNKVCHVIISMRYVGIAWPSKSSSCYQELGIGPGKFRVVCTPLFTYYTQKGCMVTKSPNSKGIGARKQKQNKMAVCVYTPGNTNKHECKCLHTKLLLKTPNKYTQLQNSYLTYNAQHSYTISAWYIPCAFLLFYRSFSSILCWLSN